MILQSPCDPVLRTELEFTFRTFASLMRKGDPVHALGGTLVYVGELLGDGIQLMRAANVAGAASICAAPDPLMQKRAIRESIADILVTTLDEALRIVKNEVRKRQGVAVAVSLKGASMLAEMRERGVLPDLLPAGETSAFAEFLRQGAHQVERAALAPELDFLVWAPAPPQFEAAARQVLSAEDHATRRWIRLSPRFLGPQARAVRSLACTPEQGARIAAALGTGPCLN